MKTVWVQAHGGSNPSSCAKNKKRVFTRFLFFLGSGRGLKNARSIGGSRDERNAQMQFFPPTLVSEDALIACNQNPSSFFNSCPILRQATSLTLSTTINSFLKIYRRSHFERSISVAEKAYLKISPRGCNSNLGG